MRSKLLRIHGKVQGVFYRESMKQEAKRLGITGWVRNRNDGCVEALVQGEESSLREIVNWCHQGPPSARVDQVEEKDIPSETALNDFLRKETV